MKIRIRNCRTPTYAIALLSLTGGVALHAVPLWAQSTDLVKQERSVLVRMDGDRSGGLLVPPPITPVSGNARTARLMELYADYRFDPIYSELRDLNPAQLEPAEIFLLVMYHHMMGDRSSIEKLRPEFASDPSIYGRLCEIAMVHLAQGSQLAIAEADALARNMPSAETYAFRNMMRSCADRETVPDYLAVAKSYLEACPNDLKAHIEYSSALKLESHERAAGFLREAIRKFPNSVCLANYLGHSLSSLKRYDEALAVYDEAIRREPEYSNLYYMRGQVAWELGKTGQYEDDTLMAASIQSSAMNRFERLQVLWRRGEVDTAIKEAQAYSLEDPSDWNHGVLAIAFAMGDQVDKSRQATSQIAGSHSADYIRNFCQAIEDLHANRLEAAADRLLVSYRSHQVTPVCSKLLSRCGESMEFARVQHDVRIQTGNLNGDVVEANTIFRIQRREGTRLVGVFMVNNQPVPAWI